MNTGFELRYGCVVFACCVGFASFDVVCDVIIHDCACNVGL